MANEKPPRLPNGAWGFLFLVQDVDVIENRASLGFVGRGLVSREAKKPADRSGCSFDTASNIAQTDTPHPKLDKINYCVHTANAMQYDLIKAFGMKANRRGKLFQLSPAVIDYINERLDKEAQHLTAQTAATGQSQAHSSDGVGAGNSVAAN